MVEQPASKSDASEPSAQRERKECTRHPMRFGPKRNSGGRHRSEVAACERLAQGGLVPDCYLAVASAAASRATDERRTLKSGFE